MNGSKNGMLMGAQATPVVGLLETRSGYTSLPTVRLSITGDGTLLVDHTGKSVLQPKGAATHVAGPVGA